MQHTDFIIWMILYPITVDLVSIASYKWGRGKEYSAEARSFASLINVIIWLTVGVKLF